jgi:hypothetical protein
MDKIIILIVHLSYKSELLLSLIFYQESFLVNLIYAHILLHLFIKNMFH